MKKIVYVLVVLFCITACSDKKPEPDEKGWWLLCYNGNGWKRTGIKCDSLQMISKSEAFVWINGKKAKIIADELMPVYH